MRHICIVGGGAVLAQPVIRHYLDRGDRVTAVCRKTLPTMKSPSLEFLVGGIDVWPSINHIDCLITMTGSVDNDLLQRMSFSRWNYVIESTLTSVFTALTMGLSRLKDNGNVVVVGSIVGSTGGYGCANYAAAKAGLVGLVRAAANENASRGICVNLLELGYCDTGMGARLDDKVWEKVMATIPLRRFATVEDVVAAVVYLGSVRYMTGNTLTLAGGLR